MEEKEKREEKERMANLVQLAKNKDAHALSLLYEMVYKDMYRMALYTLGNAHDAEDVVSETVLDAYVQIEALRDETAFRSWIFRILTNKCNHKLREYIRERYQRAEELHQDLTSMAAQKEMETLLDRQDIARAFAQISVEERLIVSMVVYGGYNSKEIAGILHMNRNTVRSKYKRALGKMQKVLE